MIASFVAGLLLTTLPQAKSAPDASRFFPLVPGSKWTYDENLNGIQRTTTEVVDGPLRVGPNADVFSIASSAPGERSEFAFFRINGPEVYTVAYDPKVPLDPPIRILTVANKGSWSGSSKVKFERANGTLSYKASVRKENPRQVLGTTREVLLVEMTSKIALEGVGTIETIQKSWYAEGIGLIESDRTADLDGFKSRTVRKLLTYSPGAQ